MNEKKKLMCLKKENNMLRNKKLYHQYNLVIQKKTHSIFKIFKMKITTFISKLLFRIKLIHKTISYKIVLDHK